MLVEVVEVDDPTQLPLGEPVEVGEWGETTGVEDDEGYGFDPADRFHLDVQYDEPPPAYAAA